MGIPILVLGESGSGKSASLRNFKKDEVVVVSVAGKVLPFKTDIRPMFTDMYPVIMGTVFPKAVEKGYKVIVIDDSQYLMADEFMRRAGESGFQKFTDIGKGFFDLIKSVQDLPEDVHVYFLHHIQSDDTGKEKAKTIGKLLDEKITLEGLFTIVLKTHVEDGQYMFATQTNGSDTVKSPIGMFDSQYIDNDLKMVDEIIRKYYFVED